MGEGVSDEDDSSGEERKGDRLLPAWKRSQMNGASAAWVKEKGAYLWAFGDNRKKVRALSIQRKDEMIEEPQVAKIVLPDEITPRAAPRD